VIVRSLDHSLAWLALADVTIHGLPHALAEPPGWWGSRRAVDQKAEIHFFLDIPGS
jgi:hypothetical protein